MRILATATGVLVLVSAVFVSGAIAQRDKEEGQPAPAQATQTHQIEGKIKNVDPSGKMLTLEDGTTLTIPDTVKVAKDGLKPGAMVKAAFEEKGGQLVVKSLEVKR